jgi:hypothetical protein
LGAKVAKRQRLSEEVEAQGETVDTGNAQADFPLRVRSFPLPVISPASAGVATSMAAINAPKIELLVIIVSSRPKSEPVNLAVRAEAARPGLIDSKCEDLAVGSD